MHDLASQDGSQELLIWARESALVLARESVLATKVSASTKVSVSVSALALATASVSVSVRVKVFHRQTSSSLCPVSDQYWCLEDTVGLHRRHAGSLALPA